MRLGCAPGNDDRWFYAFGCNEPLGVRCILLKVRLWAKKPVNPAYPAELNTLGDHLRRLALTEGYRLEVARILKVAADTVTGWELNRYQPSLNNTKAVIEFWDTFLSRWKTLHLTAFLCQANCHNYKSRLASRLAAYESILRYFELGQRSRPQIFAKEYKQS